MQGLSPPSRIRRYRLMSLLRCTRNSFVYVTAVPGSSQRGAIKLIHHTIMPMERIENECQIQRLMNHAYVMPLHEVFDYMDFRALLMPRAAGSLFEYTKQGIQHPKTLVKIFYRLFKAVDYLHSLRILHGDIKPENVLLDDNCSDEPNPLLIDFGHACNLALHGTCRCHLMTCAYSAPELLALKEHGLPSDIWSLGATVYMSICQHELIKTGALEVMSQAAANLHLSFDEQAWDPYPTSIRSLLGDMLRRNPHERPSIRDCLEHKFFQEMLGREWIARENKSVKFLSDNQIRDEMERIREAFAMNNNL